MTISTAAWSWPQWILMAWVLLTLIVHSVEHGKPRKAGICNAFIVYSRTVVLLFILAAGGFFK